MLYNLLRSAQLPISARLNVFRYITFRASLAMAFALILTIAVGPRFIALLHRLKFGQHIHEDVLAHMNKAGTPTMGGLLIIFGTVLSSLLWADITNSYILLMLLVFVGFGLVGLVDDWMKIRHHHNRGLSARAKFLGQLVVAGVSLALLLHEPEYSTRLSVPFFKGFMPDLGLFYMVFACVVLIGSSNAVNLTDGPGRPGHSARRDLRRGLHGFPLCGGARAVRPVSPVPLRARRGRSGHLLRSAHGRGSRISVVQRSARPDIHG